MNGVEYSLCVGDVGFDYQYLIDNNVDPIKNRLIFGNHDNYDKVNQVPHNLGDFGVWSVPDFGDIFFVRGAWSIDAKFRTPGFDWWADEEMSYNRCQEAIDLYKQVKPNILISHACPTVVTPYLTNATFAAHFGFKDPIITRTDTMLQQMVEFHAPRLSVFGHFHKAFKKWVNNKTGELLPVGFMYSPEIDPNYTQYICLPEFGVLDLDVDYYNKDLLQL